MPQSSSMNLSRWYGLPVIGVEVTMWPIKKAAPGGNGLLEEVSIHLRFPTLV